MSFALYSKSEYSMLSSSIKIVDLIKKAKSSGFTALSITDVNLFGAKKFYDCCLENGIKPIIGFEAKIESRVNEQTSMLFYAKNNLGYHQLLKLCSKMNITGILTLRDIEKYSQGIFGVANYENDCYLFLTRNQKEEARKEILFYQGIMEFYLGLEPSILGFDEISSSLVELANETNTILLPLARTYYLNKEDAIINTYLRAIDLGKKVDTLGDLPGDFHFKNQKELKEEFRDFPYAFDSLDKLVDTIELKIEKVNDMLPKFKTPDSMDSTSYLKELSIVGLKKRLKKEPVNEKAYFDRLVYELEVINKMGYSDYFLIVWDYVRFAKQEGMNVGPGRGSACGSLVSYSLGITDIDPVRYQLYFERFLNPERISMPDIDIDFPHYRREEVISYVKEKYGKYHVAKIVTFDTFKARGAIRDIAKAKGLSTIKLDLILKNVDSKTDLETAKKNLSDLMVDPEIFEVVDISRRIDSLPRHTGVHAAGIVLSSDLLVENIPVMEEDGFIISQFEASDLEHLGLLKMDFLGLKNLTMIDDIVKQINQTEPFNIRHIPLSDQKTFDFLINGSTTGLFQLESQGIKNVLRSLKPTSFLDIAAILALYRPGPMENIDLYIRRRFGEPFTYYDPLLEPILKETYGIIVYQEQIMQIASVFAGYSLGEADILRRAVSKKDLSILDAQRKDFVNRSIGKGFKEPLANQIYDLICKFANYGFNKSHSVAYALVAYETCYLKANYPLFFMNELLNNVIGDVSKTKTYLTELKSFGIDVLGVDIKKSKSTYWIEDNKIRFPLLGIKGIGRDVSKTIMDSKDQSFMGLKRILNEKIMESLVKSGAFDEEGLSKKHLLEKVHEKMDYSAFLGEGEIIQNNEEYDYETLMAYEEEALGFNLKYNPLLPFQKWIDGKKIVNLSQISNSDIGEEKELIVFISHLKEITTKNKEKMAFFSASNGIIEMEGFVFANVYQRTFKLETNKPYLISAIVRKRNNVLQLEARRIRKGESLC